MALLVFALCSVLIVAMTRDFNRVYQQGSNALVMAQSRAYLLGAEGLASLALLADDDADRKAELNRDDLGEIWAREAQPYPLEEGGWLVGELEDLQGRFNLNALAERAPESEGRRQLTPAQKQFVRLLRALGDAGLGEIEAIALTQAIGDWLDSDNSVRPDGAEDDYYYGLTPSYRAGNRPMVSVSELRAVSGVTPELYLALAPWVTVWPTKPVLLNIHTAPGMVLRSLGPDDSLEPLSEFDAESIVQYRAENGFADKEDFFSHPAVADRAESMTEVRGYVGEDSSWFLLRATVEVADRHTQMYSVLERTNRQISVMMRSSGGL
ncbi:general secretion pathway protein GspK [Halioglobus maricola]|uniref:Type II secretion system protein K n=1 Tax=Halioglobus maricola TaxID=2601894 RepID=A0A5P9NPM0_9GAMM|nr:general secretion pathway protein GspK [Halioglobus maricola]